MSEVSELSQLSIEALRSRWVAEIGAPPPKLRTRELLSLALAYRLQTKAHGDLPSAARRRLAELGRRFAADRNYSPDPLSSLRPGTALIKEWRGDRHEVWVLDDGFSYRGERFASLSEVAQHITGTKWNGFVFFGLKARSR